MAVARPWLAAAVAARMEELLGGYLPGPSHVLPAALGAEAGPRGALLLAEAALAGRAATGQRLEGSDISVRKRA